MEDDELADRARQLLDALDALLRNGSLIGQLDSLELNTLRAHHQRVAELLKYYRALSGYTRPRSGSRSIVPAVSQQMMLFPAALGGVAVLAPATAGAGGATAGVGSGAAMGIAGTLGLILLPIATAVILSELTGGSIHEVAGRKLIEATNVLIRDVLELGTLSVLMAITAEEAAKLTNEELIQLLQKAANGAKVVGALGILVAELINRFPKCVTAITAFKGAALRLGAVKAAWVPGRYGEQMKWARAQASMVAAWSQVLECINGPK